MEEGKRGENSREGARLGYKDREGRLNYKDDTPKEQINYSTKHASYRDSGKDEFDNYN